MNFDQILKSTGQFFTTEKTPRWQIIFFGIAVIVIGWILDERAYHRAATDANIADQVETITQRADEIERHSIDFQAYAGAFVSSILDGTGSLEVNRERLLENIIAQDTSVDLSTDFYSEETITAAQEYRSSLRAMRSQIESVSELTSMGSFWEAASDLLVARNSFLKALRSQAENIGT